MQKPLLTQAKAAFAGQRDVSSPDLSVVIVSWNTRDLLDACLASVQADLARTPALRAEVFVVDNASSDNSAALVKDKHPAVRLIENRENVGFARANNQALQRATGRHLLLLNSDTLLPARGTLLAGLVAILDTHERAAVCGPLLLNGDGSVQLSWARFPNLASETLGRLDRGQSPYPLADFADPKKRAALAPFVVDWVGGACFLVRASAARAVGLLDEDFFMYCEETEWCHRFRQAGCTTLLVPALSITHLGGQSSKAVPGATRERIYRSNVRLYRMLYGGVRAAALVGVATARFALFHLKPRGRNKAVIGSSRAAG